MIYVWASCREEGGWALREQQHVIEDLGGLRCYFNPSAGPKRQCECQAGVCSPQDICIYYLFQIYGYKPVFAADRSPLFSYFASLTFSPVKREFSPCKRLFWGYRKQLLSLRRNYCCVVLVLGVLCIFICILGRYSCTKSVRHLKNLPECYLKKILLLSANWILTYCFFSLSFTSCRVLCFIPMTPTSPWEANSSPLNCIMIASCLYSVHSVK